ncbi:MAG: phosphoribosylglycinamide formyltransferase [Prevotella sp.]|jgi:phosphoribosylglycinamide formyltransferase-1|nr:MULTISPECIES: phosphoribosylglycinamide formyltransferase [unclassified Prevotella]MCH3970515.1 phosphoribosylglycinamide formyltransferase [Prevotella sp.]MCH3986157.1 phosphoribosylglycinamide formyltransferase [Prevotella sp.]MCH3992953.1 phosphoribosylglycinamide formyltransferase [Prevotella sp.]MCH4018117.1 phosphoribosylglycinamide formyltransferase [Prevotella sp.]MCH4186947.1 phosphoribosylglycinamide formyltransferase [Prevotella sp.]
MTHIAIFVSGNGTNCENIIHYFAHSQKADISLVLSDRTDSYALTRAKEAGVPVTVVPKVQFMQENVLLPILERYHINFIVLAGFLLLVPAFLIQAYPHEIINLHPALLPKFGGKGMWGHHVHEAVKAAGETETGMTVHWVNEKYDSGQIIAQYTTPLKPEDTPDDIAAKEHILEMKYFPEVIEKVISKLS